MPQSLPVTTRATFGGDRVSEDTHVWVCSHELSETDWLLREHLSEFEAIEQATLNCVCDRPSTFVWHTPRGRFAFALDAGETTLDIRAGVASGRHSFQLEQTSGALQRARLDIRLRRPVVRVEDEAYLLDDTVWQHAQVLHLEDERNAQRVGRFDCWIKTVPRDFATTEVIHAVNLSGPWKLKPEGTDALADWSAPDLPDENWQTIECPAPLDTTMPDVEGWLWLRKRFVIPQDWGDDTSRSSNHHTRDSTARPRAPSLVLRLGGIDDEARIYLDGQEIALHVGWHQPLQITLDPTLADGRQHCLAIRCRSRRPHEYQFDGGMTYTWIRDFATTHYPKKVSPGGGLWRGPLEIANVAHTGSVVFEPRIHPAFEAALRVTVFVERSGREHPLAFDAASVLGYRPPALTYEGLDAGLAGPVELEAIAAYGENLIVFEGRAPEAPPGTVIVFRAESCRQKFGGPITVEATADGARWQRADGGVDWSAIVMNHQSTDVGDTTTIRARIDHKGRFVLALANHEAIVSAHKRLAGSDAAVPALAKIWEEQVYTYTLPRVASPALLASLRSCKQILTLNSKLVAGELKGLLTDPVKYPIFWLRDSAISLPGCLYAGNIAREAAIATADEVYPIATRNVTTPMVWPDGSAEGRGLFSDSPCWAIYAIYKTWCQVGGDWIVNRMPTIGAYLDFIETRELEIGHEPDGIVRSSYGDWQDYPLPFFARRGASLVVNVIYWRALKYAADIAARLGDDESQRRWQRLLVSGLERFEQPVSRGGFLLEDEAYLANSIQKIGENSDGAWQFPDELDDVYVIPGFRPIPHCIALTEGFLDGSPLKQRVVELLDELPILRPFPALVQYPYTDWQAHKGYDGFFEATPLRDCWKGLPGNHCFAGRWSFAGGLVNLALWRAGAAELATEAQERQAEYTLLARQPARVYEDAHSSGLFRNQSGDPRDAEGFYYTWGSATPLEALVEGRYGILPQPDGVTLDASQCPSGDGIDKVAIAGGHIGYRRAEDGTTLHVAIQSDREGSLRLSETTWSMIGKVTVNGAELPGGDTVGCRTIDHGTIDDKTIDYRAGRTTIVAEFG